MYNNPAPLLPPLVALTARRFRPCPSVNSPPQDLQKIHDLAHQWGKIVVRHAFGDDGPGLDVDLAAMEEVAVAAGGLTAGWSSTCGTAPGPPTALTAAAHKRGKLDNLRNQAESAFTGRG